MKESTLSKITASVVVARRMAQRALADSSNPQWTEYEMQSVDEWIARQDVKLDRPEAIRRLVELGLKAKNELNRQVGCRGRRSVIARSRRFLAMGEVATAAEQPGYLHRSAAVEFAHKCDSCHLCERGGNLCRVQFSQIVFWLKAKGK
jgi:hypothetical protein